jgi:cell fate (sporulation/competence/biofilm development) regulator YmcA (YheA/YmcA/DUF963 family)
MTDDISRVLRSWPYDPKTINARWIVGKDGRLRVQLRLDLGIFQMEAEGRPDGERPQGYPSLLDYFSAKAAESQAQHQPYSITAEECTELQQEAIQYYYRYLSFYALKHHEGVISDTQHNLDVIALVNEFCDDGFQVEQFLQFYPYVRMMNGRARAEKALQAGEHTVAVKELQNALDEIRSFWADSAGAPAKPVDEIRLLSDMLRDVMKKKPKTKEESLQEQLSCAIAEEDYERAAKLRDQLRSLGMPQPPPDDTKH